MTASPTGCETVEADAEAHSVLDQSGSAGFEPWRSPSAKTMNWQSLPPACKA